MPFLKGGDFRLVFAVLRKGFIEIYEKKIQYDNGESMSDRIPLKNLKLSLSPKEFHFEHVTFGLSVSE
jgi:hypothetical protein